MMMSRLLPIALLVAPAFAPAAELKPKTLEAFEEYVRKAEAELDQRARGEKSFLWVDESPDRLAQVRRGGVVIESMGADSMTKVPGGLIHDWVGSTFVPGVTLEQAIKLAQDYGRHADYYGPEVTESKLMARDGEKFHIYYRLLKKKVITVVLDTEHDVEYFPVDENRVRSRSYTTRVSQVKNPGTSEESDLPDGKGGGYLWRLNSYWSFEARDGGVYVELRAISLTRGIPIGLGWLVKPIVRDMPRISINGTLTNTREALELRRAEAGAQKPGKAID